MSRSSLFYWFANGPIHVAQSPHDAFTRHILYSSHYLHYAKELNDVNEQLNNDTVWDKRLKFWGIKKDADPFELELEELINYPVHKPKAQ